MLPSVGHGWRLRCGNPVPTEIVSDNGAPVVKALSEFEEQYRVKHIRISGYSFRANSIVERPHFDVRQALYKASNGEESKWTGHTYLVFWSDRVTVRQKMGVLPHFAVTGAQPLLPSDIAESTSLHLTPLQILSTMELILEQAIASEK